MNEKLNFRILKSKDDVRLVRSLEIANQKFIDDNNISQSLYNLDTDEVKIEVNIWKQVYILEDEFGEPLGYGAIKYYPDQRTASFTYCIKAESRGKGYGDDLLNYIIYTIINSRFADFIKVKVFENNLPSRGLLEKYGFTFVGPISNERQLMPDGTMLVQDYYIAWLNISSALQPIPR